MSEAPQQCPFEATPIWESPRVLLVGYYKPLLKALRRGLEEEGFLVDVALQDQNRTDEIPTRDYDTIVLDLMRPAPARMSIVQQWRRAGLITNIMVLTPGNPVIDDQEPESGVEEFLTKPFELEEFLVRLRALVSIR